ncbi:DUF433 domain-containing protein [Wenzhouxiangella sp. EGI_FJ10409]|uniref:DUF433 domain-containing protein n=1 Tax=Wenzhouxiangella sp. EGI_FJ10409 TaxID=3243767 RepID=UPI0035DB0862
MSTEIETRVAATVAGQTPKAIRQEFQRVLKRSAVSAGRARLQLSFRDVIYFCFKKELEQEGISVGPDERRELYSVFRRNVALSGRWRRDGQQLKRSGNVPVVFDLGPIINRSSSELRAYRLGSTRIERNPEICGGQPVFRGTRVPVQQVVEQIRQGVPVEQLREDYPALDRAALSYAALKARMGNDPGRPPGRLQIRRAAGEAAD